jgi:hypothetical protein
MKCQYQNVPYRNTVRGFRLDFKYRCENLKSCIMDLLFFMWVYLTVLSVAQTVQNQMVCLVKSELERI